MSLIATHAAPTERVLLLLPGGRERDELAARLSAHVFVRSLDVGDELPFQKLYLSLSETKSLGSEASATGLR